MVDDGTEAGFGALFAAHYPDLLRYAIRRVGPDTAPDVVADVFLVAWRRRGELPADSARLWLFGIASRTVANHLRTDARQRRLRLRLVQEVSAPDHAPHGEFDGVHAALARLSAGEQEVLRLTEWEQLSAPEAAAVLGCSPAALRVRLHRARRRFAAELERVDAGQPQQTDSQNSKEIAR